jgi:hypothetical protein
VAHQKREEIEVSAPARIVEPGFGCPHVVLQLQKSIGDVWPRISSANALQKERQGRVNGGLARSAGRRVTPPAGTPGKGNVVSRPHREKAGEVRRKTQGDERLSFSGLHIAQAVGGSRGRGCKGHRILRRAPVDRRHSGSSRGVVFHEAASTVVSAIPALSDPYEPSQKEDAR